MGFAEAGWGAVLALDPSRLRLPDADRPAVLAVSTGARAADDADAAGRTAQAVDALARRRRGTSLPQDRLDGPRLGGRPGGRGAGGLVAACTRQARARGLPGLPRARAHGGRRQVLVDGARSPAPPPRWTRSPRAPHGDLTRVLPGRSVGRGDDLSGPPGARLVVDARDDDRPRPARPAASTRPGPSSWWSARAGWPPRSGAPGPARRPAADARPSAAGCSSPSARCTRRRSPSSAWLGARAAGRRVDVLTTRRERGRPPTPPCADLADRVAAALARPPVRGPGPGRRGRRGGGPGPASAPTGWRSTAPSSRAARPGGHRRARATASGWSRSRAASARRRPRRDRPRLRHPAPSTGPPPRRRIPAHPEGSPMTEPPRCPSSP